MDSKLERIEMGSFFNVRIENIIIPNNVTIIDNSAFYMCKDLKSVVFPEDSRLESIGEMCFANTELEEFIAPPRLKKIKVGAFCDCKALKRVVLNNGLNTLGIEYGSNEYTTGAFQDSGLSEITLPSTLKEIGKNTFIDCVNLNTL